MKKHDNPSIRLVYYSPTIKYATGLHFVVPNMPAFVRDVTEHGNIGAIAKRAMKLSIHSLVKLAWWNKLNILKLLKKDFACGVGILIQMELLQIERLSPRLIALTDQITDLAVALNNNSILTTFLQSTQRLKITSAVVTNNLLSTRTALSTLGLKKTIVITPFNRHGYEMNPTQSEVEKTMKLMDTNYVYAITPVDDKKQAQYLERFGITRKVIRWF